MTQTHTDERGKNNLSASTDRCLVADVVLCVGAEANADRDSNAIVSALASAPTQRTIQRKRWSLQDIRNQASICARVFPR